jgi:hypothetical protein
MHPKFKHFSSSWQIGSTTPETTAETAPPQDDCSLLAVLQFLDDKLVPTSWRKGAAR